jgi:hypothetical protein
MQVQSREYELQCLRIQNEALQQETLRLRQLLQGVALAQACRVEKRANVIHPGAHTVEDKGKVHTKPMGRCASMATQEALKKVRAAAAAAAAAKSLSVHAAGCMELLC